MELGVILAGIAGAVSLATGLVAARRRHQTGVRSRSVSASIAFEKSGSDSLPGHDIPRDKTEVVINGGLTTQWADKESVVP